MNLVAIKRARRAGTVTECMAEIMQELYTTREGVTERDLEFEGFTSEEISTYGQKARARAAARVERDITANTRKRAKAA